MHATSDAWIIHEETEVYVHYYLVLLVSECRARGGLKE